jgi:2,4-dienoyl-CoA reductase (NADPH2)
VGKGFAVGIRVAGHDFMEGGHTNTESILFCREAEKAGIDAISMSGGWHITKVPQITIDVPPGAFLYLSRRIKEKVGIPVFVSNRLGDPFLAERALRSGAADVINWARPLLADPELPMKVKERRYHEIVPCIACNQGCLDSIFSGTPVYCSMNPRVGREADTEMKESEVKKKIFVAGGGPAGMEFALIAAQRGHYVTLYEKEGRLGGQIHPAAAGPNKKEYLNIITSLKTRAERSGVRIELETPLISDMVKDGQPDVLVVATGARPVGLDIPGMEQDHVVDAWDVLMEKVPYIGKNVVIIGGNATGCETAYFIAKKGIPDPEIVNFLLFHSAEDDRRIRELITSPGRRIMVLDMLARLADNIGPGSRWPLIKNLKLLGVELRSKTKLVEINKNAVIVETEMGRESIAADTVIIAVGVRPIDDLTHEVKGNKIEVITIGDAKEPRKISEAIREGFDIALNI